MVVEIFRGPPRTSLDEIAAKLRPALERVGAVRAYVFGSYARGRADRFSDLDLAVIVPTSLDFFERRQLIPEAWQLGVSVDVLIYTPGEWAEMQARGSPLVAAILSEGRVIHERPPG